MQAALSWLAGCPKAWQVADLGCGDAELARRAAQRVLSYDLVARAPGVVQANIAALPLADASVDAAVFCLALMGTDYPDFLKEAVRILRPGGWVWIAEVQSRWERGGVVCPSGQWRAWPTPVQRTTSAPVTPPCSDRTLPRAPPPNPLKRCRFRAEDREQSVLPAFVEAVEALGMKLKHKDLSNSHFLLLRLQKQGRASAAEAAWPPLRACQYKKR